MNTADGRFSPFCGKIAIFAKKGGKIHMAKSLSQKPVCVGSVIVGIEQHVSFGEYNEKKESMMKELFVIDDINRKNRSKRPGYYTFYFYNKSKWDW